MSFALPPLPTIPRRNNMDALRLLFAAVVLLAHCHDLSLHPALGWVSVIAKSDLAVQGFFILSGFLVFMSYQNSTSLFDYAEKRFRRLYPAYFTVVVATALGGAFLTTLPLLEYFSSNWLGYIGNNLVFLNHLHHDLPGV